MRESYSTVTIFYHVFLLVAGIIITVSSLGETFDSNRHVMYIILGSIIIFSSGYSLMEMYKKRHKQEK